MHLRRFITASKPAVSPTQPTLLQDIARYSFDRGHHAVNEHLDPSLNHLVE